MKLDLKWAQVIHTSDQLNKKYFIVVIKTDQLCPDLMFSTVGISTQSCDNIYSGIMNLSRVSAAVRMCVNTIVCQSGETLVDSVDNNRLVTPTGKLGELNSE